MNNNMESVVTPSRMSLEEYLATEPASEFKREFVNGEVLAMAGARYRHNQIVANLTGTLFGILRGGPCQPLGSDQRVLIDSTGLYAYPDLTVLCGPPDFVDDVQPETLRNPTAVMEVLSPSTQAWDCGPKSEHYRRCTSLREFWLIDSARLAVQQLRRDASGRWFVEDRVGWESAVEPGFVDGQLLLSELYRGVAGLDPAVAEPAE